MQKSAEERGRPGIIHHVSDIRWMQGGGGGVVVSAGPEAVHHLVGSVRTLHGYSRLSDDLHNFIGQFLNLFAVGPRPPDIMQSRDG